MASAHDSHADYVPGEMPIAEQAATFHGVMGLFKWGSLVTAAFLTMLVLWFCTPADFFSGAVVAVIILAVGIFTLRAKPDAAH
jgi:Bacterial aa3 type cytochrome c oxidase subunit IV